MNKRMLNQNPSLENEDDEDSRDDDDLDYYVTSGSGYLKDCEDHWFESHDSGEWTELGSGI